MVFIANAIRTHEPREDTMLFQIQYLPPGTRVRLAEMREVSATIIRTNECRAVVRMDRAEREVEFTDGDGHARAFKTRAGHVTSWSPATLVETVFENSPPAQEIDMSKKTTKPAAKTTGKPATAKNAFPKKGRGKGVQNQIDRWKHQAANEKAAETPVAEATTEPAAKPAKPAKEKKVADAKPERKMSALDAAAKVLGESGTPLNAQEMIEKMSTRGYWTSPGGKTPHATLYAAIVREINAKGADSRFRKIDRGNFELTGSTNTPPRKLADDGKTPGPKSVAELFKL